LNLEKLRKTMNGEIFIDLKNVYDPKTVHEKGFTYIGVGIT
jgi:hypothetical protein